MRQILLLAVRFVSIEVHDIQPAARATKDALALTAYRVLSAIPFRPIGQVGTLSHHARIAALVLRCTERAALFVVENTE